MAALFGRHTGVKPDFTALQIQTSTATLPIPIVWGQTKISINVIFYANFQSHGQKQGKGGLFSSPVTSYNYSADVMLALCEGPISGIGTIWRDQSTYSLADLGMTLFTGTTPQSAWSYLSTKYPAQALAYQGTAYVCAANYGLGGSANIGNHNFEVIGALAGTGINGIDADPALVIYDFLTNAQYGAGFASGSINAATLFGSGGDASLQTYCRAMGIAFSPALTSASQGSSVLNRWLQLLNCAAVWSGGQLKFIPYGDTAIASGSTVKTISAVVPIPGQKWDGSYPNPTIFVCAAANFVADGGVVYTFTGVALTYQSGSAPSTTGQYCISPNGTDVFAGGDEGQPITITTTVNNPVGYVPNTTPVYALTDLDFVDDRSNKDPVQAQRVDPFSLPTIQRVECQSRDNQYGATPIEARDQSQIELYGARVGSAIQAHEICDEVVIGAIVAQTILQRQLYVRTKFVFRLSWEYCLLDPMDIVTITDANLGLSAFPVRIVSVEEDDKGLLTVTAEEFQAGVGSPAYNPTNGAVAFQPNQSANAASVNAPLIYEPPPAATSNVAQVWVGASGGSGGIADPNWGGAFVWASVDNTTFQNIATITQPLRQGLLTASLASATGWDTTDTLAVNLAESGGVLSGTSASSAQQGATLSLVDGELLAYETATLTGANAYNLTNLQRGLQGSTPAAHLSGAPFARLDTAVVQYNLPQNWIGVPLYFKFQSFNVFGGGVQDLSTCTVYPYTPTGASALGPITQAMLNGQNVDFGNVVSPVTAAEDWGPNIATPPVAFVDLGAVAS